MLSRIMQVFTFIMAAWILQFVVDTPEKACFVGFVALVTIFSIEIGKDYVGRRFLLSAENITEDDDGYIHVKFTHELVDGKLVENEYTMLFKGYSKLPASIYMFYASTMRKTKRGKLLVRIGEKWDDTPFFKNSVRMSDKEVAKLMKEGK